MSNAAVLRLLRRYQAPSAGSGVSVSAARWLLLRRYALQAPPPPPARRDIREAVVALLKANAGVSATGAAIVPMKRPQKQGLPCLEYQVISNPRGHWLSSASGAAVARFQFDCWSNDLAECVAIKTALENALDGRNVVSLGVVILWSKQVDEHDLHEWPTDGSDRSLYRISVDYLIKHRVPIPTFT